VLEINLIRPSRQSFRGKQQIPLGNRKIKDRAALRICGRSRGITWSPGGRKGKQTYTTTEGKEESTLMDKKKEPMEN